jgi:hypothetical protein
MVSAGGVEKLGGGGTVQGPKQDCDIETLPMPQPARLKDVRSATAIANA